VSIVVAAFELERYLPQALESIISQTYGDWEAIVVDDGSKDRTWDVILSFARRDRRFQGLRNQTNTGAAATRNRAIGAARGRYVAFLDGDDIWESSKLERQLQTMKDKGAAFVFGPYQRINEGGSSIGAVIDFRAPLLLSYEDMLAKKATLGCSTVILDTTKLTGIRMPDIPQGQDYGLWLKLLRQGVSAHRTEDVCAYYRIRPGSISRNKLRKAKRQWEIYREHECLSLLTASQCFMQYAWHALFRR
jgi:teichuronic acid biosynthesis glycosyltransferase TuaG